MCSPGMKAKTVVITGATSGIGRVAALALAGQGARLVFTARDKARADTLLAELTTIAPAAGHTAILADLSVLAEMTRAAEEIDAVATVVDVLINNAGAMFGKRQVTRDGLEKTFALNHLSYFVLTNRLMPNLKKARAARIVSTSSRAHRGMRLDFDDLQGERRYSPYLAYGKSKLSNILFTRELARRLAGTCVTANCFHPGFVDTGFAESADGAWRTAFRLGKRLFAISPQRGARTLLYLAASPALEGKSGGYYAGCKPIRIACNAHVQADAMRLWQVSSALSGIGY